MKTHRRRVFALITTPLLTAIGSQAENDAINYFPAQQSDLDTRSATSLANINAPAKDEAVAGGRR